jgi:hypothetical protein
MSNTTKTIGHDLPDGTYIEIEAIERDGSDGLSPGFAITATGWDKRGGWSGRSRSRNAHGMPRDCDFAGQCHDLILTVAPELAPIVTAHLADPDGTPMHAEANGWYFYVGAAADYERKNYGEEYVTRMGTDHDRAARALHIAPEDLPTGLDREQFAALVVSLADRWAAQAQAAREALAAMVDGDGVE